MHNLMKICAVGTGYFSQFHFDAWCRLGANIKGICQLNLEESLKVANGFSGCHGFDDYDVHGFLDHIDGHEREDGDDVERAGGQLQQLH